MNNSELLMAILARCREELATQYAKKIYSVYWFPYTWPPEEVMAELKAMRLDGISRSRVLDGFLVNLQCGWPPNIRIPPRGRCELDCR